MEGGGLPEAGSRGKALRIDFCPGTEGKVLIPQADADADAGHTDTGPRKGTEGPGKKAT
jgi:hypothetical protein